MDTYQNLHYTEFVTAFAPPFGLWKETVHAAGRTQGNG